MDKASKPLSKITLKFVGLTLLFVFLGILLGLGAFIYDFSSSNCSLFYGPKKCGDLSIITQLIYALAALLVILSPVFSTLIINRQKPKNRRNS